MSADGRLDGEHPSSDIWAELGPLKADSMGSGRHFPIGKAACQDEGYLIITVDPR